MATRKTKKIPAKPTPLPWAATVSEREELTLRLTLENKRLWEIDYQRQRQVLEYDMLLAELKTELVEYDKGAGSAVGFMRRSIIREQIVVVERHRGEAGTRHAMGRAMLVGDINDLYERLGLKFRIPVVRG